MQRALRRAEWVAGVAWALSWFELYLEIYRYRHVAPPRALEFLAPPLAVGAGAQAGGWLRTVLACSALAPGLFVVLAVWRRARRSAARPATPEPRFPLARAAGSFGLLLCATGALNQVIRRPPLAVDLTLRTGNGGFVVLGTALAAAGVAAELASRHRRAGA